MHFKQWQANKVSLSGGWTSPLPLRRLVEGCRQRVHLHKVRPNVETTPSCARFFGANGLFVQCKEHQDGAAQEQPTKSASPTGPTGDRRQLKVSQVSCRASAARLDTCV
jgi:hypothetical protein